MIKKTNFEADVENDILALCDALEEYKILLEQNEHEKELLIEKNKRYEIEIQAKDDENRRNLNLIQELEECVCILDKDLEETKAKLSIAEDELVILREDLLVALAQNKPKNIIQLKPFQTQKSSSVTVSARNDAIWVDVEEDDDGFIDNECELSDSKGRLGHDENRYSKSSAHNLSSSTASNEVNTTDPNYKHINSEVVITPKKTSKKNETIDYLKKSFNSLLPHKNDSNFNLDAQIYLNLPQESPSKVDCDHPMKGNEHPRDSICYEDQYSPLIFRNDHSIIDGSPFPSPDHKVQQAVRCSSVGYFPKLHATKELFRGHQLSNDTTKHGDDLAVNVLEDDILMCNSEGESDALSSILSPSQLSPIYCDNDSSSHAMVEAVVRSRKSNRVLSPAYEYSLSPSTESTVSPTGKVHHDRKITIKTVTIKTRNKKQSPLHLNSNQQSKSKISQHHNRSFQNNTVIDVANKSFQRPKSFYSPSKSIENADDSHAVESYDVKSDTKLEWRSAKKIERDHYSTSVQSHIIAHDHHRHDHSPTSEPHLDSSIDDHDCTRSDAYSSSPAHDKAYGKASTSRILSGTKSERNLSSRLFRNLFHRQNNPRKLSSVISKGNHRVVIPLNHRQLPSASPSKSPIKEDPTSLRTVASENDLNRSFDHDLEL
jgi:hypothetical protein